MEYKFRFSVIIPVYRTEEYLAQTLDSVIRQDIGFEKHIQVVLVTDREHSGCRERCLEWQRRYPDNIVCVVQENTGVGAANNEGCKYVQGKYVNFLDSAVSWSERSFQAVYDFFEKKQDKVDVVCCPCKSAGKRQVNPPFGGRGVSRIIDVLEQYTCTQGRGTAAFFKVDVLSSHRFDERLTAYAGAAFTSSVLLEQLRFGIVTDACQTVAENRGKEKGWYMDVPEYDYLEVIRESRERYGEVLPFIQYRIAEELQWRLREDLSQVLTQEEQCRYERTLREVLAYLDDDIICQPDKMYVEYKIYALSLKYGADIRKQLTCRKGSLYFKNIKVYGLDAKSLFSVDVLDGADGIMQLSGRIWCPFADELSVFFENDRGERYPVEARPAGFRKAVIFGRELICVRGFEITLPLEGVQTYNVYGIYQSEEPYPLHIRPGKFARITPEIPESYYECGGYRITFDEKATGFRVRREAFFPHLWKEIKLLSRCLRDGKYEIAGYRILSRLVRPFLRRERWLVMERIHVAGDNAEHFYRFLKREEGNGIRSYFAIAEGSPDFEKMKRVGNVLPFRKFRYKLNVLLAKNIISSQAEDNLYNPWDKNGVYIRDLYRYRFVFLQHGIIKDDLSEWLNKFNKNLQMFVTSANPEYRSILEGDYFYDDSVVKLTGLPRYDELNQNIRTEKSVLFLPTWRFSLAGPVDNDTGERAYNPSFRESEFFRFYQKLIQDKRLLTVMKRKGYKGKFFLHTQHNVQMRDFTDNDTIQLIRGNIDYQEEFQKNALMVTDFSSVAFDFAYLKKPVIYTQFDVDTFFEGQVYSQGYFDYEKDGLGPVCYDYETTLQTILDYVEHDCQLEAEYDKRANAFYRWFDRDNCKRVYEEICSLGQNREVLHPAEPVTIREEQGKRKQNPDRDAVSKVVSCALHGDSPEERQHLLETLQKLDDCMLCDGTEIPADIRLRLFSLKYGRDIRNELVYRNGRLKFENLAVVPLKEIPFVIKEMIIVKGRLKIAGNVVLPLGNEDVRYYVMDNRKKRHEIQWEDGEECSFYGEKMHTRKRFSVEIGLGKKKTELRFMFTYQDRYHSRIRMAFAESLGIKPDTRENFTWIDDFLIKSEKQILSVVPLGKKAKAKLFFTFPIKSIKIYLKKNMIRRKR